MTMGLTGRHFGQRMNQSPVSLEQTPFAQTLGERGLEQLRHCIHKKLEKNQILFSQGDTSTSIYLVLSGTLSIQRLNDQGHYLTFDLAQPASFFGELAAIDGGPRTASIIALTAAEVIEIPKVLF